MDSVSTLSNNETRIFWFCYPPTMSFIAKVHRVYAADKYAEIEVLYSDDKRNYDRSSIDTEAYEGRSKLLDRIAALLYL